MFEEESGKCYFPQKMGAAVYSKQYIDIFVRYKNHKYLVLSSSISVFPKGACMGFNVKLHFSDIKAKHLIVRFVLSLLKMMKSKVLDSWLEILVIWKSYIELCMQLMFFQYLLKLLSFTSILDYFTRLQSSENVSRLPQKSDRIMFYVWITFFFVSFVIVIRCEK
jgi:hypothetical protein